MTDIAALVADNLAIWTGGVERRASAGRGGGKRFSLYGIERLRALVLDLAVRGKLVPQDPGNEPASVSLRNLRQQRARNRNARKTFANSSPKPFDVPASWEWVHVSDIGHDWGSAEPSSDFTYIDVGAIDQNKGVIDSPSILSADEAPSRARRIVKLGTVLYSTVRPYLLNVAIVDRVFDHAPVASTAFAVIHPFDGVIARYIYYYLRSPTFVAYVEGCQAGIAYPAINDRQFFSAWFPLPPFAEQERIVAKVDELMSLCDRLEEETAAALEAHQRLGECLLATLVDSLDATDLAINWSRLEALFDILFTTDESIEALKRTVRELAVRGKLVPQDPNEEEAINILKYIQNNRYILYSKKLIPKPNSIPNIDKSECHFDLPRGWIWATLGDLCYQVSDGPHFSPKYVGADEGVPFLSTRNVSIGNFDLKTVKYVSREDHEEFCKRIRPEKNDIIYTKGGTTGVAKLNDLNIEFSVWVHLAVLRIEKEKLNPRYVELCLNSPHCYRQSQKFTQGISNFDLGLTRMIRITVPVPPLAEQHRIVAKVDALVALCDSLNANLAEASETQKHLAGAIVEKAAA